MHRLILIGYMGVGKTTLGKALAKATGLAFYDLDWYIESRMRRTVKQLFDERGEEGFRQIEQRMLHEVAEFENVVISCGGGTPCFFDNMDYMNRQGHTLYLKAMPDVILEHLRMSKNVRPLLLDKTDEQKRLFIEQQLEQRRAFYEKAQTTVDVTTLDSKEKIAQAVAGIVERLHLPAAQL